MVVFREAMARGVELMPLSAYCSGARAPAANGLVLGFAAVRPETFDAAFERLAAAIEAARRAGRARAIGRSQFRVLGIRSNTDYGLNGCATSTISHHRPAASRLQSRT